MLSRMLKSVCSSPGRACLALTGLTGNVQNAANGAVVENRQTERENLLGDVFLGVPFNEASSFRREDFLPLSTEYRSPEWSPPSPISESGSFFSDPFPWSSMDSVKTEEPSTPSDFCSEGCHSSLFDHFGPFDPEYFKKSFLSFEAAGDCLLSPKEEKIDVSTCGFTFDSNLSIKQEVPDAHSHSREVKRLVLPKSASVKPFHEPGERLVLYPVKRAELPRQWATRLNSNTFCSNGHNDFVPQGIKTEVEIEVEDSSSRRLIDCDNVKPSPRKRKYRSGRRFCRKQLSVEDARRERNRLAAQRYRERRRIKKSALAEDADYFAEQNSILKNQREKLLADIARLKLRLRSLGCTDIRHHD